MKRFFIGIPILFLASLPVFGQGLSPGTENQPPTGTAPPIMALPAQIPVTSLYSTYYQVEPKVVDDLAARKVSNDDISVALFLAREAKVSPEVVMADRNQGLSWATVTNKLGVKPDVYFTSLPANPGPPYGNAWGYWRNRRARPAFNLGDDDLRNLVQLRMVSEHYKVPPKDVVKWRRSGKNFDAIIADENGKKKAKSVGKGKEIAPGQSEKKGTEMAPGRSGEHGKDMAPGQSLEKGKDKEQGPPGQMKKVHPGKAK